MKHAILAVRVKKIRLQRASKHFNVSKSTQKEKVNSGLEDNDKLVTIIKLGGKPNLN